MKLVMIEWVDSSSFYGWHRPNERDNWISKCVSVGIKIYEDDIQIAVAQSKSDSGNVGDVINIPKSSISKISNLKVRD